MGESNTAKHNRLPTARNIDSTLSTLLSPSSADLSWNNVDGRIKLMAERAKNGTPLTEDEIEDIANGLRNLIPIVRNEDSDKEIKFTELKILLREVAHLSHKDWVLTSKNSDKLCNILCIELSSESLRDSSRSNDVLGLKASQVLERILGEGNWDGAMQSATCLDSPANRKSWAVLVTGVNGIRKTTSIYQPWFGELLSEALVCPSPDEKFEFSESPSILPNGSNSFFRQLDHIICTLCNEEFTRLYAWSTSLLEKAKADDVKVIPSDKTIEQYSNYKAAIFSRYRTLSELFGALLLKQAQKKNLNCLMETSGRDIAMFHYVDHFFGENKNYKKLALHFIINELSGAKKSVDRRMIDEMERGAKAIKAGNVFDILYTNQGGPYGSKALEGVQRDSDEVWKSQILSGAVGKDWYKATIAINAHESEPWTAQAVRPDGSLGKEFTFVIRK
mmetsp:Transcript_24861/g.58331  ORF Transcript_24861/g.58331 Transcript_24861/m.58331 type:complete len:448 (-) Transcript_24861:45-1388(-)|eukprot:CAMPEP_0197174692 /NCGR_PEP_ID=MMETSP1423-20130617/1093_1 /TAXON_ID=476441 /ORGANISM="Pseudo-nitzschia heimii, Strain UNC1101" /LENGTH=447 /DNA_ID=CAMNT_0042623637 /DNA_START=36 /DNA_END=1379 /DNA_ORIENTATION=+